MASAKGLVPAYVKLRLTEPAKEALLAGGNTVEPDGCEIPLGTPTYRVGLHGKVPEGIVEVTIQYPAPPGEPAYRGEQGQALRLVSEPPFEGEFPLGSVETAYGAWVPCPHPRCSRALVWYEAGYVPGYRICTKGHHAQLSSDWRSAEKA